MNNNQEKVLYCVKGNHFLFIAKNVWNTIWFSIGITISIGLGTILIAGIGGIIWNNEKMNLGLLYLGGFLIPAIIILRIIYIIMIRKNQFYMQTIIQQILGCGNIVVSSAATHRASIILVNIDNVKTVYATIEANR